ncbi:3276_t:CDS:2 [Paraglomus brasilianum]|uniref:3276_t:CDS:1 n=1 Tax=Paraglomus brasilianum TaxID=144538 RepID=A0A9N9C6A5_9GLOM|nr:3276_t:CDS:2 [Paraglomus brasilianum]
MSRGIEEEVGVWGGEYKDDDDAYELIEEVDALRASDWWWLGRKDIVDVDRKRERLSSLSSELDEVVYTES